MSDAALRALEQRFRATPSEELEIQLLQARLRAEVLSPERLRVAALLGHPLARRLVQDAPFLGVCEQLERLAELEAEGREAVGGGYRLELDRALAAIAEQEERTRAEVLALVRPKHPRFQESAKEPLLRCRVLTWLSPEAAFRAVIASFRTLGYPIESASVEIKGALEAGVPFSETAFMADYDPDEHAHVVASAWSMADHDQVVAELSSWALGHTDPLLAPPEGT